VLIHLDFLFKHILFKLISYICVNKHIEVMEEPTQEQQLTAEELMQRKEQMFQFYTESMKYLNAQFEYEEMLLKIDAARFERIKLQMQHAMLSNPPEDLEGEEAAKENLKEEIKTEQKKKLRKM